MLLKLSLVEVEVLQLPLQLLAQLLVLLVRLIFTVYNFKFKIILQTLPWLLPRKRRKLRKLSMPSRVVWICLVAGEEEETIRHLTVNN